MRLILLALVVLGAPCPGLARAEEPATSAPGIEDAQRLERLTARAREWWAAREKALRPCTRCGGDGRLQTARGVETCGWCRGTGKGYVKAQWMKLYLDMRSPAWRAQPTAVPHADEDYARLDDNGGPAVIDVWKVHEVALVGQRHGTVTAALGKRGTVTQPQRWIWAIEPSTKQADWFTYEQATDGPWPKSRVDTDLLGDPLPEEMRGLVAASVSGISSRKHDFIEARQAGQSLYLRANLRPTPDTKDLDGLALHDLRHLTRAIWVNPKATWADVRWTLCAQYRNKFGEIEWQPYMHAWITRETYNRIRWENLDDGEALALFRPEHPKHPDLMLWKQE